MTRRDRILKYIATIVCLLTIAPLHLSSLRAEDSELYVRRGTWQETLMAAHGNLSRQQSQGGAGRHESALAIMEGIIRDFPEESRWFKKKRIHKEHVEWLISPNDTKIERDIIKELLGSIDSGVEALREKFDNLCRTDASGQDGRWLDLYVESMNHRWQLSCFKDMDHSVLRSAIVYLAETYPSYKAVSSGYLARLDDYESKLLEANQASSQGNKFEPKKLTAISEEFVSLRKEALIGSHPLIDFDKLVFVRRYTYQSSHYYTDFIDGAVKFGGNLCVVSLKDGKVTELVPELEGGIFGRFDLSYDARRVVFDYKAAPGQGFRIYEIGIDGKGLRQLTFDPPDEKERIEKYWLRWHKHYQHHTDDMHPCYLPDGRICFVSTRCERGILCDARDILTSTVLYAIDADGSNMQILSDGSVSEEVPSVMNDGRILYTRWEYVDKGGSAVKCLWAMHPDGSGSVEIFGSA